VASPKLAQTDGRSNELNLLENLPPLDLPPDAREIKTAAASAAKASAPVAAEPAPVADAASPEPNDVATAPAAPVEVTAAPGLRRFAVVEPKLAGGSLPTSAGLDWLNEKGYKTVVDLRDPAEVQPAFIADVSKRGLRYISLPISLNTVDDDHISRFHFELSLADARPLYFFDSEGNRAGMLWYIHRMLVKSESYDPQEASRQAEELGLGEGDYRKAAQSYLDTLTKKLAAQRPVVGVAAAVSTTAPAPAHAAPEPVPGPRSTPMLPDETNPPSPDNVTVPGAAALDGAPAAPAVAARPATPAEPVVTSARDPNAWKSMLALLLAGLGVPLAYWGRSFISYCVLPRASLPAPRRRPRSLPVGSGE
jgi:protein tyrosine phosphatase (PTP) superfamily phosphohydrolase (DUF442 family)